MNKTVGFDFGTTNSVMSMIVGDRCISLLDNNMPHPSVVCYQGNQTIVGRRAKDRLGTADVGVIGNIVKSPKTMLGQNKVFVDGHSYSPKTVVRDVVSHVRADACRQMPEEKFDRAVVTIPVDMNGERRRELREACRMAGLGVVQFVHEPLAALYGHLRCQKNFESELRRLNRELILVFDWGGGTLDLTLCRIVGGMLVQIMNDGCSDVGGDIIDDLLVNEIERLELEQRGILAEVGRQVGAKPRLRSAAETAKVQLSGKDVHTILVTDYFTSEAGDPDIAFRLRREQLEQCVETKVNQGIRRIHDLLDKARIDPASIQLCLATGGMVNMPLIQMRLNEIFGPQRVCVSDRGNTIISEGAAWIAHDEARLSLAKNVEVLVSRQAYFPVVKASTPMPREGQVQRQQLSMYCVDPRDGIANFQICAPKRTGRHVQVNDERDVLSVLSVGVDSGAQPLRERILLDVAIDQDLVLKVGVRSSVAQCSDDVEIHSLEFGLALPNVGKDDEGLLDEEKETTTLRKTVKGSITLRSNVSNMNSDFTLVPGELMRQIDPYYFDLRRSPPAIQDYEKLYYQPCSYCRLVRCECAERRGATNNADADGRGSQGFASA